MPILTRRRYPERPDCWHIYYGDVCVGTIARRVGNPFETDPWEWTCGFYPGSHPRECTSDTSETFEQARTDFEASGCSTVIAKTSTGGNGSSSGTNELSPLIFDLAHPLSFYRVNELGRCGIPRCS